MHLSDALASAVEAMLGSKLRSLLATLGIVIGIAAVSTLISFGEAFRAYATAQMAMGEAGTLVLLAQPPAGGQSIRLSDGDVEALARLPGIRRAVAELTAFGEVRGAAQGVQAELAGVRPDALAHPEELVLGRWLMPGDEQERARVAVLTLELARLLFPDGQPVGQSVWFEGMPLRVVGVRHAPPATFAGELRLFVPLATVGERAMAGGGSLSQVTLTLADPRDAAASAERIRVTLRARHALRPEQPDTFTLRDFRAQAEINDNLLGGVTLLLGGIGGIALLVGGIGIMNIMLVSVSERTQEIGLRKAVGARRRDILLQFLLESIALSSVGGAVGLLVSLALVRASAVALATGLEQYQLARALALDPGAALLGLGFAALVGVLAGSYPAHQASKLHPIAALRGGR